MTSRDILCGLVGAAVIYFVVERRKRAGHPADAPAGHVDDDDDGPEADGKPCCAACASSSLWSGGCGGTSPRQSITIGEQVGGGGGRVPIVAPWILTAPPTKRGYDGTGIMSPGRLPPVRLYSATGGTVHA
jgi:hypothetical protein